MDNLSSFFYTFAGTSALLVGILGLWLNMIMPDIDHWSRKFFRGYFFIIVLFCLSSLTEKILYSVTTQATAIYTVWLFEGLLFSMPCPMLTIYMLHCSGESMQKNKLLRAVIGLWTVLLILNVGSLFIGGVGYIYSDQQNYRSPTYPIFIMPLTLLMVLNLQGVIRRRRKFSRKVFLALLIAMLPLTVALVIQLFTDVFVFHYMCIVLSSVVMYGLVLSDQIERNLHYQHEIANQRASIMVLQMRPHFIYNTMTSIYCLCGQDPKRARQVILDFTTYLRRNFTAIVSMEPIPFSAELDHTRAYLAVEKAQYEESLFVDYDTPHTFFRIPSLTLQPVVENSVKHGRNPYAGPLHILIKTRKTESGSEIIVSDDGSGYVSGDDDEPHIALKNIRERLDFMCGGDLTITTGENGGTVVTITIPDNSFDNKGTEQSLRQQVGN